jgi:hypothetical protein
MNSVVSLSLELLHCDHLGHTLDNALCDMLILRFYHNDDRCFNR